MFTLRHALGRGLLFMWISSPLALSADDAKSQQLPFCEAPLATFADVWREPTPGIEPQFSVRAPQLIEWGAAVEADSPGEGEVTSAALVAASTTLWPTSKAPPMTEIPHLVATSNTLMAAETGLIKWLLGMLCVVGVIALGGVYWIYQIRPALEVHSSADRLRMSSTLSLPRRSGLFLVDVEDQTVLVAMDGGGVRQVVPLGMLASMKSTRRRAALGKAQHASSLTSTDGAASAVEAAFHDVYQEQRSLGGVERVVPTPVRSTMNPQIATAHSRLAP